MVTTPAGIVTLLSPLQPLNKDLDIIVILSGIVILVSSLQPLNAPDKIVLTLSGIDMLVSVPAKASSSIEVTPSGITLLLQPKISFVPSFDKIQLFTLLKFGLLSFTVILVSPLHPQKALPSIYFTLSGIVMLVSPLQP